jgi:hypothetical protein
VIDDPPPPVILLIALATLTSPQGPIWPQQHITTTRIRNNLGNDILFNALFGVADEIEG